MSKVNISANMELNDLRKIICLRRSEVSVEKISFCIVIENLVEHGILSARMLYR